MSNIKVGDYVEVTVGDGPFYSAGAGGRVMAVASFGVQVWFTHGQFSPGCKVSWWVDQAHLRVTPPYSRQFTEPAKPAAPTTGHVVNGGGLQKHSVGAIYPLAVVGYANDKTLRFTVENLETGGVAACGSVVRSWHDAAGAASFAKRFTKGKYAGSFDVVTWTVERPIFEGSMLVFPSTERFVLA